MLTKDVVCEMQVEEEQNQLTYLGVSYSFCSEQCRECFQENPLRHETNSDLSRQDSAATCDMSGVLNTASLSFLRDGGSCCNEGCYLMREEYRASRIEHDGVENLALAEALAATLDAITSDRPYRKAASYDKAHDEIVRMSGTQFDPFTVQAFIAEEVTLREMVEAKCMQTQDSAITQFNHGGSRT